MNYILVGPSQLLEVASCAPMEFACKYLSGIHLGRTFVLSPSSVRVCSVLFFVLPACGCYDDQFEQRPVTVEQISGAGVS